MTARVHFNDDSNEPHMSLADLMSAAIDDLFGHGPRKLSFSQREYLLSKLRAPDAEEDRRRCDDDEDRRRRGAEAWEVRRRARLGDGQGQTYVRGVAELGSPWIPEQDVMGRPIVERDSLGNPRGPLPGRQGLPPIPARPHPDLPPYEGPQGQPLYPHNYF
jgi:hypothetical protein